MRRIAFMAAAGMLALAGCSTGERQPDVRPAPAKPTRVPALRAPSPADYVARAGSIDLFLIRSSEMALTRSQDARLRDVARRITDAHHGTAAQLSLAGRRLNLLPSAQLHADHQRMFDTLAADPQFDRLYWRHQVMMHEIALDMHSAFATAGGSPTLRPVAAAAAPIYRRHLEQLRAIR